MWKVYSDGACSGNPGPAGWGVVVISPQGVAEPHSAFLGHGTNQTAEMNAAIEALARVPEGAQVQLFSDSQYVLKGLTEWRKGWERKGFVNSKGQPVANQELWKRLYALADKRKVTTQWVRGHNGDKYNEMADSLATAAVAQGRRA